MLIVDAQVHLWKGHIPANPGHSQIPNFLADDLLSEMDEAAIQVDLEAIADGTAPFPFQPPFAYMSALGLNIYLPLAFASRMRVTTDAGVENESTGDVYRVRA